MKKISIKILSVALTIAVLASLILGVMPVAALSVPSVTFTTPGTISSASTYSVTFDVATAIPATTGHILVTLPSDTNASTITGVTIGASSGIGAAAFGPVAAVYKKPSSGVGTQLVDVQVPALVGAGATVQVVLTNVTNPSTANTYTLTVSTALKTELVNAGGTFTGAPLFFNPGTTSVTNTAIGNATVTLPTGWTGTATNGTVGVLAGSPQALVAGANTVNVTTAGDFTLTLTGTNVIEAAVTSGSYTIALPTPAVFPGAVHGLNAAGIEIATNNTDNGINIVANTANVITVKVDAGTFVPTVVINPGASVTSITATAGAATTFIQVNGANNFNITNPGLTLDGFTFLANATTAPTVQFVNVSSAGGTTTKTTNLKNLVFSNVSAITALNVAGTNAWPLVVTNCSFINNVSTRPAGTFSTAVTVNKAVDAAAVTFTGCTFSLGTNDVGIDAVAGVTQTVVGTKDLYINNCTFTGTAGTGTGFKDTAASTGVYVANSTFNGLSMGISETNAGSVFQIGDTNTFTANGTVTTGGAVYVTGVGATTLITNNTFSGNTGYSISLADPSATSIITGNSFTGNSATKGVRVVATTAAGAALNAKLNWWGAATGPNTTGAEKVATVPTTAVVAPFLTGASTTAATGAGSAVAGAKQIDAAATVGVVVSGYTNAAGLVEAVKYANNPVATAPPYTAAGYFDVYLTAAALANNYLSIQFYVTGITAGTQVYYYNTGTATWIRCDTVTVAGNNAFVLVNIGTLPFNAGAGNPATVPNTGDLTGTIFAVVNAPAVTPTFNLVAPVNAATGTNNVPFTWASVPNAASYTISVSTNPNPTVNPVKTQAGLTTTSYSLTITGGLTAGTPYFWKVDAFAAGNTVPIASSAIAYFTPAAPAATVTNTVTAPAATETRTVTAPAVTNTVTAPGTTVVNTAMVTIPNVTVTQPAVTNTATVTNTLAPTTSTIVWTTIPTTVVTTTVNTSVLPAPIEQIAPSWIWGIIGIGAVLIIVVIVLIVRTRRSV